MGARSGPLSPTRGRVLRYREDGLYRTRMRHCWSEDWGWSRVPFVSRLLLFGLERHYLRDVQCGVSGMLAPLISASR